MNHARSSLWPFLQHHSKNAMVRVSKLISKKKRKPIDLRIHCRGVASGSRFKALRRDHFALLPLGDALDAMKFIRHCSTGMYWYLQINRSTIDWQWSIYLAAFFSDALPRLVPFAGSVRCFDLCLWASECWRRADFHRAAARSLCSIEILCAKIRWYWDMDMSRYLMFWQ